MNALTTDDIVGILAEEIAALSPGDRIGSEHDLMRRFDIGRAAARTSIGRLQAVHLVRRVQGSGTYVNQRIDYVISRSMAPSLHKTVEATGATCETVIIGYDLLEPPETASERMAIPRDARVQSLTRLSHINGLAAMFVEEWIAPDVCDHVDIAVGAVRSVDETLRGLGLTPVRAWCRASLDIAPPHARTRLELDEHEYTWVVESMARDEESGTPLFYSRTYSRRDAIRLVLELDDDVPVAQRHAD